MNVSLLEPEGVGLETVATLIVAAAAAAAVQSVSTCSLDRSTSTLWEKCVKENVHLTRNWFCCGSVEVETDMNSLVEIGDGTSVLINVQYLISR